MACLNYIPPLSVTLLPVVSPDYTFGALSNLINLVDTFTVDTASKHSSTFIRTHTNRSGDEGDTLMPIMVRCDAWPVGAFSTRSLS